MKKAPIYFEITSFLQKTGLSLTALARESSVNVVYLHRLVRGDQTDLVSANADAIRATISRLESEGNACRMKS